MRKSFLQKIILLFFICVCYFSCSHDKSNCTQYQITSQETALLDCYNNGNTVVFKNDSTGVFDTLHVTS